MSVLLGNSGASVILSNSGGGVVRAAEDGLLTTDDFTYIGSIRLPSSTALRGGQALAFSSSGNSGAGSLYLSRNRPTFPEAAYAVEISIPTPVISATSSADDLTRATLLRSDFDVTGGLMQSWATAYNSGSEPALRGLAVINVPGVGDRIFWTFARYFNFAGDHSGHGYSNLDGTNAKGVWYVGTSAQLGGYSNSKNAGYIAAIPQAWADTHTGGRSIACGFHVLQNSAETCGGAGFMCWAPWVDDPSDAILADQEHATCVVGANYPGASGANEASTLRMRFPTGVKPTGYNFTWNGDTFHGAAHVVASDGRSAFVTTGHVMLNNTWYDDDGGGVYNTGEAILIPAADGSLTDPDPHKGYCTDEYMPFIALHDMDEFASAIATTTLVTDPKPYAIKDLRTDLVTGATSWGGPENGSARDKSWNITGCAFDATSRRLYVSHPGGDNSGLDPAPVVHVYQVA